MGQMVPIGFLPTCHAQRDPRTPYVTQNGLTVTRGEFESRSNRRARQLQAFGIGRNDFVAMLMPNCIEFFETTFALWKLGATPVPLSQKATRNELAAYFELLQPRAVIGDAAIAFDGIKIPGDLAIDETVSADTMPECTPRYWRISITGGSTGRPKLIVDHTPAVADPVYGILEQKVGGVHLNPGPLYHSGPFGLAHRGLFVGSHLVNMEKFDPVECLALVERYKVDWLYMVPTMMHRIWRLPEAERTQFDLAALKIVFHMASICPSWLKENWINWLGPEKIWELYSGAENPGRTVINGTEWLAHRGSVGRVQPGSKLAIFDEAGRQCAPHEVGEVYFMTDGGPDAAFRYIGAEKKSLGDWQSLGDLGYLDDDGYLYIVDRRTDLIISGGINVYPAEVEAALDSHPSVESSVVIGLPDADLGQRVHAIVQVAQDARDKLSDDDMRTFLAGTLARYKIPRTFEYVHQPLKDNTGKVRRSALREQRLGQGHRSAHLEPTAR